MGKALKTAGVIIGAAALIATGVGALAMPGLAGATTLFGVSTGTLNTISSGLVAVGGMLDKPKSQGSAQPDEWTSNPDQPIPFLFGRMGVAGKIVQRDEFGPDNMYQGIVGIISGAGPIKGIQAFKGDDQAVAFDGSGKAVTSQWQGEMWMVRRAGNQPDTVLAVPSGLKTGGSSFQWSASAKLSGKACYLQILGENSKGTAYPGGIPDPVHVGEGIYGYDPRYDSTYPGGDGPCRLGVRSTYRYIDDPIIGGLNWALGMVENGQVVGGIGASPDGIDLPAFVEAANISEANGWKLAAWPDTSEDASSVLDQFLQAGGAVRARHAGKISCVSRGAPRASVVTVTARDMAGAIELNAAPSLFDQLNTITPRFMSEAAGWKLTPANPVSFAQYVTDDGGKHSDQIDYRFVPLLKQAAELAAYDILDAREPFSGSVPMKPHMRQLKRGDCFVIDNPGVLLDGVKCIVLSRSYDPKTAEVRIGFRSETDGKHDLALGKTTTLPEFPVLTPPDPTYVTPPQIGDWTIVPRPPAPGGGQLPGFDLGGIVSNETATSIIVEYGPTDEGPWTQAYEGPPTVTSIPIDGLQPGTFYYVAIRYRRDKNYSERYVYGPYQAPALVADDSVNVGGEPAAQVLGQLADAEALAATTAARVDDLEIVVEDAQGEFNEALVLAEQYAEASEDAAVASDARATAAETARGQALTYAGQASTARDDAVTARIGAETAATNADAAAATVLAQASEVSDDAASASLSAQIAASMGTGGGFHLDPTFQNWPVANPLPTNVTGIGSSYLITRQTTGLIYGDKALRFVKTSGGDVTAGLEFTAARHAPPDASTAWVVDYQVTLNSGSFAAASFYVRTDFASGYNANYVGLYAQHGLGTVGQTYRGSKFIRSAYGGATTGAPTANTSRFYGQFSGVPGNGASGAKDITVHLFQWRPATQAEIEANEAIPDLEAQAAILAGATADLQDQIGVAFVRLIAASGGNPAYFEIRSSGGGSAIALRADTIAWGNNTVFDDATDQLTTTTGTKTRVLAFGAAFGTDGTLTQWEGPSSIAAVSRSRANAYFYVANAAPYIGGSAIASSDQARAQRTSGSISTSGSLALDFSGVTVGGVWEFSFGAFDPLSSQVAPGNSGNWAIYEQTTSQTGTQGTLLCSGTYTTAGSSPTVFTFAGGKEASVQTGGTRRVRLVLSGATDSGNITANLTAKYFPPAA